MAGSDGRTAVSGTGEGLGRLLWEAVTTGTPVGSEGPSWDNRPEIVRREYQSAAAAVAEAVQADWAEERARLLAVARAALRFHETDWDDDEAESEAWADVIFALDALADGDLGGPSGEG